MLTRWNDFGLGRWHGFGLADFDGAFAALDQLRRDMDRWFTDFDRARGDVSEQGALPVGWPRVTLSDEGSAFLLRAELPGMREEDVRITVDGSTLTLAGERKVEAPEGYAAHRRERQNLSFSRSTTLPTKVDAEKVQAKLANGVLELTLPKAPEAQPRQIAVKGS
jgi:HSP20 family protein